ncbi:peptide synthetase [Klebsiella pneumoniae]|nr:peptide synthetase [Klebsiella pneumoniae]
MLPVLRKRELVFTRQVADGIAIAGGIQQKNIGEVGKHRATAGCSGVAVE